MCTANGYQTMTYFKKLFFAFAQSGKQNVYIFLFFCLTGIFVDGQRCVQLLPSSQTVCYTVEGQGMSWRTCNETCSQMNNNMINADNEILLYDLHDQLISSMSWESVWLTYRRQVTQWKWLYSGAPVSSGGRWITDDFQPPGQPYKDCAAAVPTQQFHWSERACGEQLGYICETDAESPLCAAAEFTFDKVVVNGPRCFMFKKSSTTGWFRAKRQCERVGTELAALDKDEIYAAFHGLTNDSVSYWIALTKVSWTDVQDGNFWLEDQPSGVGACSVLTNINGKAGWADQSCTTETSACACEILDKTSTATKPTSSIRPSSPSEAQTTSSTASTTPTTPTTTQSTTSSTMPTTSSTMPTTPSTMPTTSSTLSSAASTLSSSPTSPAVTTLITGVPTCIPIDLCVTIDLSDALTSLERRRMQYFTQPLMNYLDINDTCVNDAVITMAENYNVKLFNSLETVIPWWISVFDLPQQKPGILSNIFSVVASRIFVNDRQSNSNVILVILGSTYVVTSQDIEQSAQLKQDGVVVIVIAHGENNGAIGSLASKPSESHVFKLQSDGDLTSIQVSVLDALDNIQRTTTSSGGFTTTRDSSTSSESISTTTTITPVPRPITTDQTTDEQYHSSTIIPTPRASEQKSNTNLILSIVMGIICSLIVLIVIGILILCLRNRRTSQYCWRHKKKTSSRIHFTSMEDGDEAVSSYSANSAVTSSRSNVTRSNSPASYVTRSNSPVSFTKTKRLINMRMQEKRRKKVTDREAREAVRNPERPPNTLFYNSWNISNTENGVFML